MRSMKGERKAVIVLITRRLNARVITGTRAGTTQVAATGEGFGDRIWWVHVTKFGCARGSGSETRPSPATGICQLVYMYVHVHVDRCVDTL